MWDGEGISFINIMNPKKCMIDNTVSKGVRVTGRLGGSCKELLGPTVPYYSAPFQQPTFGRPDGCPKVSHPKGEFDFVITKNTKFGQGPGGA
jgi:hypothetical protein